MTDRNFGFKIKYSGAKLYDLENVSIDEIDKAMREVKKKFR
jgi:hypothetical protein